MPSRDTYYAIHRPNGVTNGEVRRSQSNKIMDETWWEDTQSSVAYIYDYYHDSEPLTLYDLHPEEDPKKTPIDIKFIETQYATIAKGQEVEYHLQFRPSQQECILDYYKKDYEDYYGSEYPIGLYVDIKDNKGKYRRWLICMKDYTDKFSKYMILPCNHLFHWCADRRKYDVAGIRRTQSS